MDEDNIEQSDFILLGQELQKNKNYLKVVDSLETQNKKRVIYDRESNLPYLIRYYYMNLRPFARVTIHKFLRSDIDGLHNHPWDFQTFILSGGYWEVTQEGRFWREPGYTAYQSSNFFHKIELDPEKAKEDTWTLFLMGPKQQDWGFLDSENQWVQWEEYLNSRRIVPNQE